MGEAETREEVDIAHRLLTYRRPLAHDIAMQMARDIDAQICKEIYEAIWGKSEDFYPGQQMMIGRG